MMFSPTMTRLVVLLALELLVSQSGLADSKPKLAATLKDLRFRKVNVTPQAATTATPEQAAEAYRRFLELQNANPQLRVEAMRRLGDLNVEANENALATTETEKLDSKTLNESIELYESLLKAYPQYPNADAVLYQLSRAYEAAGKTQ